MPSEPTAALPALHDRVLVPGERIGVVVGFYRGSIDTVLVRFDTGDEQQYIPEDLSAASR